MLYCCRSCRDYTASFHYAAVKRESKTLVSSDWFSMSIIFLVSSEFLLLIGTIAVKIFIGGKIRSKAPEMIRSFPD